LSAKQTRAISKLLIDKPRDQALFHVGIDSMLRRSDLRHLTVEDVTDSKGIVREECGITQQKTKKTVTFNLSETTCAALQTWIECSGKSSGGEYLFSSRTKNYAGKALKEQPISQMQYQRLVKGWIELLGLATDDYSTHSLRKTKASAIYDATKNVEAVRQLLGHASVAATSAYLGIEQAKALDIAKNHKMF
jgi:integrase